MDAVQADGDADGDSDAIRTGAGLEVIPAPVAADGVDEVFGVFLPRMLVRGFPPAVTRQIGVRAVDTGDEWTLTPVGAGEPPRVDRSGATGEAVISGRAVELDLCLWKRLPAGVLTVDGDTRVAAGFLDGRVTPQTL